MMEFEPLPTRTTVSMDAVDRIKNMILDGRLVRGERLPSERALSEVLGVSRPTVREAIRALVAMHILEVRHGSGTFVSSRSMNQLIRPVQFAIALADTGLRDLFDVRGLIEPGAAALAAQRASDAQLQAIDECVALSRRCQDDHREFAQVDFRLHGLIVEASHNGLLINLHESIAALTLESRTITVELPGVIQVAVEEHEPIAQALLDRNAPAAEAAMRRHLEHVRDMVLAALRGERAPGTGPAAER